MTQPCARLISLTAPVEAAEDLALWGPVELIEFAGRVDYGDKSTAKMGDPSIIARWIASGHESMIEMADATFLITCSRVVSHELVRHRLASFQQESQRYVNYDEEAPEDLFILPPEMTDEERGLALDACTDMLALYGSLIDGGIKRQFARYVLPNAMRTRIVVKANFREWRHILKLRMHKSAQPEFQVIAKQIHDALIVDFPEVFGDIAGFLADGERADR